MTFGLTFAPTREGAFEIRGAHIALTLKRAGYTPPAKTVPAPTAARPPKPTEPLSLPWFWGWDVNRNAWRKARIYY